MTRLLITGVSGLLGINLALEAVRKGYQVTGIAHQHSLRNIPFQVQLADLSRVSVIGGLLESCQPDGIIHCAAIANLEAAEANPEMTQRVNVDLPGRLAAEARRRNLAFIHLSTDAVFDGLKGDYSETDLPNPQSVYARTKLAGEHAVADACPDAMIARVNFYGWSISGKRSLAEFFFYNLSAGQHLMGFKDVLFCPLEVHDLAELLLQSLEKKLNGIYHVVSRESLSKYDFGVAIARKFGLDETLINPASVFESSLVARRSPNLTLRVDKIARSLHTTLPDQADGLGRFYKAYQANYPQKLQSLN